MARANSPGAAFPLCSLARPLPFAPSPRFALPFASAFSFVPLALSGAPPPSPNSPTGLQRWQRRGLRHKGIKVHCLCPTQESPVPPPRQLVYRLGPRPASGGPREFRAGTRAQRPATAPGNRAAQCEPELQRGRRRGRGGLQRNSTGPEWANKSCACESRTALGARAGPKAGARSRLLPLSEARALLAARESRAPGAAALQVQRPQGRAHLAMLRGVAGVGPSGHKSLSLDRWATASGCATAYRHLAPRLGGGKTIRWVGQRAAG